MPAIPAISLPTLSLSALSLPAVSIPSSLKTTGKNLEQFTPDFDKARNLVTDVAYVGVGAAVLGLQQARTASNDFVELVENQVTRLINLNAVEVRRDITASLSGRLSSRIDDLAKVGREALGKQAPAAQVPAAKTSTKPATSKPANSKPATSKPASSAGSVN